MSGRDGVTKKNMENPKPLGSSTINVYLTDIMEISERNQSYYGYQLLIPPLRFKLLVDITICALSRVVSALPVR